MAEKYQRPDNREEISCEQENLPQIGEIPDLSDTIELSLISITLKDNNQKSIALANNPILYTCIKHIDI